jgi:hypothetical protein
MIGKKDVISARLESNRRSCSEDNPACACVYIFLPFISLFFFTKCPPLLCLFHFFPTSVCFVLFCVFFSAFFVPYELYRQTGFQKRMNQLRAPLVISGQVARVEFQRRQGDVEFAGENKCETK